MSREGRGSALRHARWQAVLAIAAIAASVALPVVLVSVGGGVAAHELSVLENEGYQIVASTSGSHGIEGAHAEAQWALDHVPSVTAASPVLSVAVVSYNASGANSSVLAEGVVPREFTATLGPTQAGLFPDPLPLGDPNDSDHFANGSYTGPATYDVLVSTTYAAAFDVVEGSTIVLSPTTNESAGTEFNVTGYFGVSILFGEPEGAYAVLLPLSDLQVMTHYANGSGTIVPDAADSIEYAVSGAVSADPAALAQVAAEIQAHMPYYTVTTLSQEASQLKAADDVLTGFYLALSSVGLAVGVLFLALVLLRRVEAGRRSIGIRRALGVPAGRIAAGLLRDGLALSASGAGLGVAAGYVLVELLSRWGSATVRAAADLAVFDPVELAAIALGLVALSLVASAVAVRAALRVEMLEALR